MIIRVRSSVGTKRVNVPPNVKTLKQLKEAIAQEFKMEYDTIHLSTTMNGEILLGPDDADITTLNINNGDMLYLVGRIEKEVVEKSYIGDGGVIVEAGVKFVAKDKSAGEINNHTTGIKLEPESAVPQAKLTKDDVVDNIKDVSSVNTKPPLPNLERLTTAEENALSEALIAQLQQEQVAGSPEIRKADEPKKMRLLGDDEEDEHLRPGFMPYVGGAERYFDPRPYQYQRYYGGDKPSDFSRQKQIFEESYRSMYPMEVDEPNNSEVDTSLALDDETLTNALAAGLSEWEIKQIAKSEKGRSNISSKSPSPNLFNSHAMQGILSSDDKEYDALKNRFATNSDDRISPVVRSNISVSPMDIAAPLDGNMNPHIPTDLIDMDPETYAILLDAGMTLEQMKEFLSTGDTVPSKSSDQKSSLAKLNQQQPSKASIKSKAINDKMNSKSNASKLHTVDYQNKKSTNESKGRPTHVKQTVEIQTNGKNVNKKDLKQPRVVDLTVDGSPKELHDINCSAKQSSYSYKQDEIQHRKTNLREALPAPIAPKVNKKSNDTVKKDPLINNSRGAQGSNSSYVKAKNKANQPSQSELGNRSSANNMMSDFVNDANIIEDSDAQNSHFKNLDDEDELNKALALSLQESTMEQHPIVASNEELDNRRNRIGIQQEYTPAYSRHMNDVRNMINSSSVDFKGLNDYGFGNDPVDDVNLSEALQESAEDEELQRVLKQSMIEK